MKKFITMMIMVLAVAVAMAQAPEKFSYQAVVRNASNALVTNAQVGVRVSILQGSANGNAVYVETHTATTNANGLLTIEIGGGTVQQGSFAGINWANGPFFLKMETDPAGGSNYTVTSTQQLMSVPYALYAKDAGNVPTVPVNVSAFTNDAGYITAQDIPEIPTVPTNVSAFVNDVPYMTSFTEQQILTISNDTIFLTGGSFVKLPEGFNGDYNSLTNTPAIPTVPTNVSAFVNDMGYLTSFTEQQVLSISNDTIFLTGGSFVKLPAGFDGDYNNLTNTPDIPTVPADVSVFNNDANYVSNTECADVDLCALATALAQLQALVEEQQQRIEDLEAQMGSDTTTIDTTTVTNGIPCPGTPTVTDYDGNVYNTVLIGSQCWTKENLRTTHFANGTSIPAGGDNGSYTEPYYYDYSTHSLPLALRGYLYNWPAANQVCPAGWHLPSDAEWNTLEATVSGSDWQASYATATAEYRGSHAGKLAGYGWNSSSTTGAPGNATDANHNASGFSAVPAGYWEDGFSNAGDLANFWSSTEYGTTGARNRTLSFYYAGVNRNIDIRYTGFSVRCLRDEDGTDTTQSTLPTVITSAVSDITETTATCGGEVIADGGAAVTEHGVCWSTSATPTVADNHTSDGAGLGTFTSSIANLTASTTYYVRAYATNSVGTAYGETVTFTTEATTPVVDGQPCPGTPTVTDHEGNVYATVQIGNQCWMRDNLRTTTSPSTGTYLIPTAGTGYTYTGKQARWYDNDSATYAPMNYGLLYNWNAAVDTFNTAYGETSVSTNGNNSVSVSFTGNRRGICPSGWHLPSDAEWTQLTDYVSNQSEYTCGGNSSYIAKALASETVWNSHTNTCAVGNDPSANNAMGFSAVPAGYCSGSSFYNAGYYANFCSSSQYPNNRAWTRTLNYNSANVLRSYNTKYNGYSVRCLRNEGGTDTIQSTLPTVITGAVSDITETTATCGGEVIADGGATVTVRGVCWSTSASPTVADTHTSDGMGMGTFTSSIANLTASTTYYVRAYATNSVGTAYGETVTFTTEASTPVVHGQPCPGTPTVTDYDGNVYNTVLIGNQCWTKENLRTTHYADGTAIPAGGSNQSYTESYYYDYSSHSLPLETRGYLYNWPAAMVACPTGWHLPSDAEWTQLTDYVSSQTEYTCDVYNSSYIAKALASETGWNSSTGTCAVGNDQSANNASGFTVIPAGHCNGASFYDAGYSTGFWSSTEDGYNALVCNLNYSSAIVDRVYWYRRSGFSVRCLRNEGGTDTTQATLPTVITGAVSGITETTAICGGNVTSDGDATVTARGVCWSTSVTPTIADNHTSDGLGIGTFTSNITGLTANTTYYVRAYATNSVGTAYGETVSFTTSDSVSNPVVDGQPCPGTPTVTDYDGNVYNTVLIGNQCWTKENLRTTHYADGTASDYFVNPNLDANVYGYYYYWSVAMHDAASSSTVPSGVQGICPAGWHLPSDAEWMQLTDYVGSVSEYQCGGSSSNIAKALASETGWISYSGDCAVGNDPTSNNATGFSAVPAGFCRGSRLYAAGYSAYFWSSTENSSDDVYDRHLNYSDSNVVRNNYDKNHGRSVRCLRTDTIQATLPTVITGAVSDITETRATCGGNVTSDGGALVTERGVCWSTSATPTIADNHTFDGAGLGTFTSNITGLTAGITYYLRAYAINSVDTAYGETVTFTTEASTPGVHGQPCPGTPTVTDVDGNTYITVQIGDQCWTKENLRTTHYADGMAIPAGGSNVSYTEPYYYDYSSHSFPLAQRGYLYNWSAAMHGAASSNTNPSGVQGICPTGWHLPSDAEWTQLTDYVGSQPEYTCGGSSIFIAKALASETGWSSGYSGYCAVGNDPASNNASGFSAVPAGSWEDGSFSAGSHAAFWSSTEYGTDDAWNRSLYYAGTGVARNDVDKNYGFSVRCLRD